jgi:hypothetical protein
MSSNTQSPVVDPRFSIEDGWFCCNKCQSLFYRKGKDLGACPKGDGHDCAGSPRFHLQADATFLGH